MKHLVVPAFLLAFAIPMAANAQAVPPAITAALADPLRPEADRARDATRHAGEILAFSGVKPGDKVGDFIMGGGYWTRILSATVGSKGHVWAYQPAEFIKFNADYAVQQKAAVAPYGNITAPSDSLATYSFPSGLDVIVTVQNYHDLHLKQSPAGFAAVMAKRLFDSLKPGGVLLVVDHVANADPGFAAPDALHRIDPAAARAEIESAGFKFDGELALLRNAEDTHSVSVFNPAIRGKTDQFIYRFRKP